MTNDIQEATQERDAAKEQNMNQNMSLTPNEVLTLCKAQDKALTERMNRPESVGLLAPGDYVKVVKGNRRVGLKKGLAKIWGWQFGWHPVLNAILIVGVIAQAIRYVVVRMDWILP